MKEIIDVIVEEDPEKKERDTGIFSLGRTGKAASGFNFIIRTSTRDFRLQAHTKVEQMMWVRGFAVLFELRARVIANFNSRTLETIKSLRSARSNKSNVLSGSNT